MQESFGRVAKYLKSEAQTWGKVFGLALAFFILVTAITNAIYGIFGFSLLPVFENTLDENGGAKLGHGSGGIVLLRAV